jgi:hypothetical protein
MAGFTDRPVWSASRQLTPPAPVSDPAPARAYVSGTTPPSESIVIAVLVSVVTMIAVTAIAVAMMVEIKQIEEIADSRHIARDIRIVVVVLLRVGQIVAAAPGHRGVQFPVALDELHEGRMFVVDDVLDVTEPRNSRSPGYSLLQERHQVGAGASRGRLIGCQPLVVSHILHASRGSGPGAATAETAHQRAKRVLLTLSGHTLHLRTASGSPVAA